MRFEQKTDRSTNEKLRGSESVRLWLATLALTAGGAALAHEAITTDERREAPVLTQYEDESGDLVTIDQFGDPWVSITLNEGGTIHQKLGGDREAIARTIEANGIQTASDVKPEQPLWAPADALERN